ncbi:MAG: DnaJ domain-containing protein [Candidatus Lokiarchaeota archaeon]|nr:DnaJ domain-containing protein [Candidatus Lokiarchaeota archaeon]
MRKREYYRILGLSNGASKNDIKIAYRKLAKKYHPDFNKGDPNASKKFMKIQEAYEQLSKQDIGLSHNFFDFPSSYYNFSSSNDSDIFTVEKFFQSMFNGFNRPSMKNPSPFVDIKRDLYKKRINQLVNSFEEYEQKFRDMIRKIFRSMW